MERGWQLGHMWNACWYHVSRRRVGHGDFVVPGIYKVILHKVVIGGDAACVELNAAPICKLGPDDITCR